MSHGRNTGAVPAPEQQLWLQYLRCV